MRYIKRGLFWRIFGRVAEYSIGEPISLSGNRERIEIRCKCGCSFVSNVGHETAFMAAWLHQHEECWRDKKLSYKHA